MSAAKRYGSLAFGLLITIGMLGVNTALSARQACSKDCGVGGEVTHGFRKGCGSSNGCLYVQCTVANCDDDGTGWNDINDDCHNHKNCTPLD